MCGIAGYFNYSGGGSLTSAPMLRKMTRLLESRGPDEEAFFESGGVGLGHRRLKVLDLEGGKQPMTGRDARFTLVFNGEIYNHLSIRSSLEKKGRAFVSSHSDTETILRCWEDRGALTCPELEGMFAFAVYDAKEKALYLSIDRFGKKPLYYADIHGQIVFASQPKSILAHPLVSRQIDPAALSQYLLFEYVPAPNTIFASIKKMERGTLLKADARGIHVSKYDPGFFATAVSDVKSEEEWSEALDGTLASAVEKRLMSDVPLGVFLSGGLDSSSVLAMVKRLDPGRTVKTFGIGFEEASFDESQYSKQVAQHFGTEHVQHTCSLGQMVREHETILSHLDEPMADASFIPTFILCRMVRQHVTVALAGDGGDELFAGYPTFAADRLASKLKGLPSPLVGGMKRFIDLLPVSMDNLSLDFRLKQFFKGLQYDGWKRNQVWLGSFGEREQRNVLDAGLKEYAGSAFGALEDDALTRGSLEDFYLKYYLQGDILVKADRASMANSLEVRSPFLDDALFRLARKIPSELKLKGKTSKYILKKTMRGKLPDNIIDRPKKGFGIPVAHWIRADLRARFEEELSPSKIRKEGFFDAEAVQKLLGDHLAGKKDNRKQLWTLYVFQVWKRNWAL